MMQATGDSTRIKILSYNVHWGLSAFRKHAVEERLVRTIVREDCDIVLLQELWLPEDRTLLTLVDHLRKEWRHHLSAPTVRLARGEQGNGLLSRFPIASWSNHTMPFTSFQDRALLHANLRLPQGQPLAVICTHFGLNRGERLAQATYLCSYVEQNIPRHWPLLIAGDFNDWRGELSPVFAAKLGLTEVFLSTTNRHARTFPAILPLLALDRIYSRHLHIQSARVVREAGWHGSSDHLPLLVELVLPGNLN